MRLNEEPAASHADLVFDNTIEKLSDLIEGHDEDIDFYISYVDLFEGVREEISSSHPDYLIAQSVADSMGYTYKKVWVHGGEYLRVWLPNAVIDYPISG